MLYKPQKLEGRTYTLCGKRFQLYSIEGFDFIEPLGTEGSKGIYCFTKCVAKVEGVVKGGSSWMKCSHSLIYLGKSSDFGNRPHYHEKFSTIKDYQPNYLALYDCEEGEDPKEIETIILSKYFFKVNESENKEIGDRLSTVLED